MSNSGTGPATFSSQEGAPPGRNDGAARSRGDRSSPRGSANSLAPRSGSATDAGDALPPRPPPAVGSRRTVRQPPADRRPPPADADLKVVTSPMVGTFYSAPNPESPPFVKVGDHVGPESVVCIIEAMKVFNKIQAEISGQRGGRAGRNRPARRIRPAAVQDRHADNENGG